MYLKLLIWAGIQLKYKKNFRELVVSNNKEEFLWESYDSQERRYLNLNLNPHMEQGKLCEKDDFWEETIRELITAKPNSKDEL